jgi:hypothetical protein
MYSDVQASWNTCLGKGEQLFAPTDAPHSIANCYRFEVIELEKKLMEQVISLKELLKEKRSEGIFEDE